MCNGVFHRARTELELEEARVRRSFTKGNGNTGCERSAGSEREQGRVWKDELGSRMMDYIQDECEVDV